MNSERTIFNSVIPQIYASISKPQHGIISSLQKILNNAPELSSDEILQLEDEILQHYGPASLALKESNLESSIDGSDSNKHKFIKAKGLYLSTFLAESMGQVLYDSLNSSLLTQFPQPLHYTSAERTGFLEQIKDKLTLTDNQVERVKTETDYVISNLHVKRAIVDYLNKKLSAGLGHNQLFENITGINALSHETIDITLTNATVFFTFDFTEHGLNPTRQFSLDDHAAIEELFQKLKLQSNSHRANFPAVGEWSAIEVNQELILDLQDFLAAQYNFQLSSAAIRDTLVTMVFLLPRKSADAFLVHDAYGHSWQENLCEFEHLYRYLAELNTTFKFEEISKSDNQSNDEFLSSIIERFYAFYSRKLAVAHNAVLAELTADVIEFHLQKKLAQKNQMVPTSSALRDLVLFLDLTLSDIEKHFRPIEAALLAELSPDRLKKLERFLSVNFEGAMLKLALDKIVTEIENIHSIFKKQSDAKLSTAQLASLHTVLLIYPYLKQYGDLEQPYCLHQYVLCLTSYFQEYENHAFFSLPEYSKSLVPLVG